MKELQREEDMSIVYITHNMAVIAETVDRVYVMYLGQVVESTTTKNCLRTLYTLYPTVGCSIPRPGQRVDKLKLSAARCQSLWIYHHNAGFLTLPRSNSWSVQQNDAGAY